MLRFILNFLPSAVWTALILLLTLLPGNFIPVPRGFWLLYSPDKLAHLGLFAVLGFLIMSGMVKQFPGISRRSYYATAMAAGMLVAVATEMLQAVLPTGRDGNLYDGIADVAGIVAGCILFSSFYKKKRKKVLAREKIN